MRDTRHLQCSAAVLASMIASRMLTLAGGVRALTSTAGGTCDSALYFKQLLAGRDIADPAVARRSQQQTFALAKSMVNFQYLVGDPATREALVIDGCYDPDGIIRSAEEDGYKIVGYVATHAHYDHIGRSPDLAGVASFVGQNLPAWIHEKELQFAADQVAIDAAALSPLHDGSTVSVGGVTLAVKHTPGHSPGSVVLQVTDSAGAERLLITGDTLFPGSCGRVDLPGSDVDAMFGSLRSLAALDDALPVYPGHGYSGNSSTIGREKASGLLSPQLTLAKWRRMMAR
jgi:glyoxylase-like metal-dependent hydrolase (beta-lactamase superfamily II)